MSSDDSDSDFDMGQMISDDDFCFTSPAETQSNGKDVHDDDEDDDDEFDFVMESLLGDDDDFSPTPEKNDNCVDETGDADDEDEADLIVMGKVNDISPCMPNIPLTRRQRKQSKSDRAAQMAFNDAIIAHDASPSVPIIPLTRRQRKQSKSNPPAPMAFSDAIMAHDASPSVPIIPLTRRQRKQSKSDPPAQMSFSDAIIAHDASPSVPIIPLTRRQRKQSKSDPPAQMAFNQTINKPPALLITNNIQENDKDMKMSSRSPRQMWKNALKLMRKRCDPWINYHIEKYETHRIARHRYNALNKSWSKDECFVKMEPAPFNHGAMRECYRLKKMMSQDCNKLGAHNYVAKVYIQDVDRDSYFEDVVLQMDAKLWGEEYNRHDPPKKVDIFQMAVIEFVDQPGSPLYHLEHFIEGEYIKYNSNSGFVDEHMRLTPQAFSHFTFERSGHELIVIDIQGVGDLYTDPQIHTADGKGYGDGNLGTRGMALFFHSHCCNQICKTLKLAPFDMSESERKQTASLKTIFNSATQVRGYESTCISPSCKERIDLVKFLRLRSISSSTTDDSGYADSHTTEKNEDDDLDEFIEMPVMFRQRYRNPVSESDGDSWTKEEERQAFSKVIAQSHRSSCFQAELNKLQLKRLSPQMPGMKADKGSESILGMVHLDLAKYHESGRFSMDNQNERDHKAIYFHLERAAKLCVMEAILTMAHLHLNLQRDLLEEYDAEDFETGLQYMEQASKKGSRESAVLLGQAYQNGHFGLEKDWRQSIHFYEQARKTSEFDDGCGSVLEHPGYTLIAAMAAMHAEGGNGIDSCPQKAYDMYNEAAEEAQAALKGRLAMKYYELAEEAGALIEE